MSHRDPLCLCSPCQPFHELSMALKFLIEQGGGDATVVQDYVKA